MTEISRFTEDLMRTMNQFEADRADEITERRRRTSPEARYVKVTFGGIFEINDLPKLQRLIEKAAREDDCLAKLNDSDVPYGLDLIVNDSGLFDGQRGRLRNDAMQCVNYEIRAEEIERPFEVEKVGDSGTSFIWPEDYGILPEV